MVQSYANSGGTGARTGSITVTTTATLGSGAGTQTHLVDGNLTASDTFAMWFNSGQSGKEIKFDFGSGRVIDEALWYQDTGATHGLWTWYGSNDDSSYTAIGGSFTLGGYAGIQRQVTLHGNTTSYRYYKLLHSGSPPNTSSNPYIKEIEFRIDGTPGGSTDYSNTGGYGDRTSSITVTTTATTNAGTLNNLVDGAFNEDSSDAWQWNSGQSTREIKFDFGTARVIDEASWQQNTASSNGTWKWQGSNNDSSYTDIGSTFTLGGTGNAGVSFLTQLHGNTTAYRYYKLLQTAGTTVTTFNVEIEFRIDAPSGATGTWASTEATDTCSASGSTIGGSWASTEAKDVFAGSGGTVGGSWASTEAKDTVNFSVVFTPYGAWHSTEAADVFAGAGYPKLTGSWAITEAADVFAGAGGTLGGSWHSTEAADTFAGAGYPKLTGSWASTEAKDIINFQVFFCPYGAWHSTEATDAFAAQGAGQVIGTMAVTEAKDVFAGAVAPNAIATWASTEAHDVWAGTGYPKLRGTWASTEAKDVFHGVGLPLLTGTWESTEVKDHFAGTGYPNSVGSWGSIENPDTFFVNGGPPASLGIDAHATGSSHESAFASVTITTNYVDDVIVLGIVSGGFWTRAKVASITDTAGLVWKKRYQRWQVGSNPSSEIWWAKKTSAGPTTITVHTASNADDPVGLIQVGNTTGFLCVDALAIKGANADRPFDTHTGAGWFTDSFGSGNPTGHLYSNSTKGMAIAFYGSSGVNSTGTVTAGWTWLERVTAIETSGQTGRIESAYKVFDGAKLFTDPIQFGQVGGASNSRAIMQDVIVSKDEPDLSANATDDVIRWFFDGHGNQTVLQLSGTNNSATQTFQTFEPNSVAVVAVMIESTSGARVDHVTDDGNHSGWARRSIVANDIGTKSFEVWWCQFPAAYSGNITVVADSNIQAGDIIGFTVTGIHGPDATLRGEIWDGDSSLPNTATADDVSGLPPQTGPFSTLNNNVLELNFVANTGSVTYSGDPTGFQQPPWLQFVGDYFSSVGGELVSQAPNFNIATDFKFSAEAVDNESVETDVSPLPSMWFMIVDAMPVGPPSPPTGTWHSTETPDHTSNSGAFTAIGLSSLGWVGYVPATATMAATDTADRATNSGAFTAIWNTNGWIGYIPLYYSFAITDSPDIMLAHAWIIGNTTILAKWDSTEDKDRFAASSTCLYSSYTTADSVGDRTSRITVTSNAVLGVGTGTVDKLVNGGKANGSANSINVALSQPAAMWFRFDFGSSRRITEAKWYQNGVSAQPGLWLWRGSDDLLTWDILSGTFTLNGGNGGSVIGSLPNCAFYRYWEILQTTNAGGNDTPWLWEIEFKVDGIQAVMAVTELKDRASFQGQVIPTATPIPARKRRLLIVT